MRLLRLRWDMIMIIILTISIVISVIGMIMIMVRWWNRGEGSSNVQFVWRA